MNRFEVQKRTDDYVIWDSKLHQNYSFGGIVMRGSEQEMVQVAADLNKLQLLQEKGNEI